MILLDTNVLSELMRPEPEPQVLEWVGKQKAAQLGLSTITVAEIERGLQRMPEGKRRTKLEEKFSHFLQAAFQHRIFPFGLNEAKYFGQLAKKREQAGLLEAGLLVEALDLIIAATAATLEAKIATRNTADFSHCGIKLINPWESS